MPGNVDEQGPSRAHTVKPRESRDTVCHARPGEDLVFPSGSSLCDYLDIRLTAPLAVRGGKNSSENQQSPDSILLRILSRNLSERTPSSTGVEALELSLELSALLLVAPLESVLPNCQLLSTL